MGVYEVVFLWMDVGDLRVDIDIDLLVWFGLI